MLKRCYRLTILLLCAVATISGSNVNALKFTSIDYPGAFRTEAAGINIHGQIVGSWEHPVTGASQGFLLSNGRYQPIAVPGARGTYPQAINDAGVIVGAFDLPPQDGRICCESHGFVRTPDGQFTIVTFPSGLELPVTWLSGINNLGQMVGGYSEFDETIADTLGVHGFLWTDGVFTSLDFPSTMSSRVPVSYANAINDAGDIVGGYNDGDTRRGYVLTEGIFNEFDIPGAALTDLFGINNSGEIVGEYQGDQGLLSFLFTPRKGFYTLALSGNDKRQIPFLLARSISSSGRVVGSYSDYQDSRGGNTSPRLSISRLRGYAPGRRDGITRQDEVVNELLAGSVRGFLAEPPSRR